MEPSLVYRPFALLALAAALLVGTPLGLWLLAWLYWGLPAAPASVMLLHAHVQVFGFFATLIPGVAHHLVPRFTGRPMARPVLAPWLAGALAVALGLRTSGTAAELPVAVLAAALLESAAFTALAVWIHRALDPPPLALVRRHLTLASAWLALACLEEAVLRAGSPTSLVPAVGALRAAHAAGLVAGVVGWVLGVLLRAGPMFVAGWAVPGPAARAVPWALALAAVLTGLGETLGHGAVARLGETVALATVVGVLLAAGVLRPTPRALPMLARGPEEARIFRLAAVSAGAALLAFATATGLALAGQISHVVADAGRHLLTVGFLTSVVVAMLFRLIPVLESAPLPWPGLRAVAFWALAGAVTLRTGEVLVVAGIPSVAPLVPLSGPLVWVALAAVAVNLLGVLRPR